MQRRISFKECSRKCSLKKSLLSKLCPRIDDQGVMHCDSRLWFAECLPYDVRFPIISLTVRWVMKLTVKHHHKLANSSAGKISSYLRPAGDSGLS